ncbi:MAG: diaminopimelate epimerase [Beijerinckiaceae bacterium]
MNGLGNEIAIVDLRGTAASLDAAAAGAIGRGLPFDQLMVLFDPRTRDTEAFIEIYNSDGSRAEACGNGTRCVAAILFRNHPGTSLNVETAAGRLECQRIDEFSYSVDMGTPRFGWAEIPLSRDVGDTSAVAFGTGTSIPLAAALVNMGNPHAIFFVESLTAVDLATLGPQLEHDELFPERANISLAEVAAPDHIRLKVWERGAGLTLACGSAACAALVAAARAGLTQRTARVSLPGGDLTVTWRESDEHVVMTGPVAFEFETKLDPALFESLPA